MKQKIKKQWLPLLLMLLLSLLLAVGCGGQKDEIKQVNIQMQTENVDFTASDTDDTVLLSGTLEYPVFSAEVDSEIIAELNKTVLKKVAEYKQNSYDEYWNWALEEYRNTGKVYPYTFQLIAEVKYNEKGRLSMLWTEYAFTGGAHGNSYHSGVTYDLNTGEELTLGDLMEMSDEEAYATVIQRYTNVIKNDPDTFFAEASDFVKEHPEAINFYFSADGPVVFYQVYDVASYAAGRIEVVIGK